MDFERLIFERLDKLDASIEKIFERLDSRTEDISELKNRMNLTDQACNACREKMSGKIESVEKRLDAQSPAGVMNTIGKWASVILSVAAVIVLIYNFIGNDIKKRSISSDRSTQHETNR